MKKTEFFESVAGELESISVMLRDIRDVLVQKLSVEQQIKKQKEVIENE